jgi:branched-chain amino acid transport system substrate-binding protein
MMNKNRKAEVSVLVGVCLLFILYTNLGLAAEKVLKFGILGPFTGIAAKVGAEFRGSTKLALEKINYKVGDYTLQPVWIDSQSDPAKAVNAYAEAAERDEIQAGILNWHSSVAVAIMDVVAKYKVPHMFSFGAADMVNEKWKSNPKKYSYWGMKGWPIPGKMMAGYAETMSDAVENGIYTPKNKTVAACCEDTDWGHSACQYMIKELATRGWKVVHEDYFPVTQTDFYPILSKYKKNEPGILFSTSSGVITSAFIKQTREVGLKSMVIIDGLGWQGNWYEMTGKASNTVLDMIPQLTSKEAKEWATEFEDKFDMKPSPSSGGLSYDGINFFIKLLKRTLDKYNKLDKESIHRVMVDEIQTGKLTFSKQDGAIIMNEYRTTESSMPDPIVARNGYYFPVIQYKNGNGYIVYPKDWANKKLETW